MTTPTNKYNNTILRVIFASALALAGICICILSTGCGSDLNGDDPIPGVPFDPIVINLNLPAYVRVRTDGGYVYLDGGIRGIILYRESATSYLAFERNCSFHPNDACATVDVHSSTFYMVDTCCNSTFSFPSGEPNGGPASRPLLQYRASLRGTELTITDDMF